MKYFKCLKSAVPIALLFGGMLAVGCSDDIDDSDMYSFTGDVITTYVQKQPELSEYAKLLDRVRISKKSESTMSALLSTRGNYTCFAPTNDALHAYIDSLMVQPDYPLDELSDSLASIIVKNSLIDTGNGIGIRTTDFIGGVFGTNMNDRYMIVDFDTISGQVAYRINNSAVINVPDVECENGYVHVVDGVVSASMAFLPNLMEQMPNLKTFSRMLFETGLADSMLIYQDEDYEANHPEVGQGAGSTGDMIETVPHRRFGFTVFVEPDELLADFFGINPVIGSTGIIENWNEIREAINEKCSDPGFKDGIMSEYIRVSKAHGSPTDWRDPYNVVNQFLAYHIIPSSMSDKDLVIHSNEYGYDFYNNPTKYPINCVDNYVTMGPSRRLLRITEGPETEGKRINRLVKYDRKTYQEVTVLDQGLLISTNNENMANNALNGFYYPIDDVLVYTTHTKQDVFNDRMRWDLLSYTYEASTNRFRNPITDHENMYVAIPNGYLSDFFVRQSERTHIVVTCNTCTKMSSAMNYIWHDYQLNEYMVRGSYDFVLLIPPVPTTGTYELRWGMSNNENRSMTQVYFGDNPDNLAAIGLPVDMRIQSAERLGWVADIPGDDYSAIENDKTIRIQGYLKAPQIACELNRTGPATVTYRSRGSGEFPTRKILWNGTLQEGKKYYLRFKTVMEKDAQFFGDYLEIVPKSVYAGVEPEDPW